MSTSLDITRGATAPAGWYDDGSGSLRWWDGRQWTEHFQGAMRRRGPSRHLWWALSPAYTLGLVAFIPAVHAAIALRRVGLWLWASVLIGADVLAWTLMSSAERNPDGSNTPAQNAGVIMVLVLAVLSTVHAFRVRDEVFAGAGMGDKSRSIPVGHDPAIVTSLAARQRRKEAAALAQADPGLALDLRIGRPDLVRDFDDGGLIDVNHVPEAHLVSYLGLTGEQARLIVEVREHMGGFQSVAELSGFAEVPAQRLDAIRDRIVML